MSIWRRLRIVAYIAFGAVTLWVGWALVDDLHASALGYDRSPMVAGTPSPNHTKGIDWGLLPHPSVYAQETFGDQIGAAWENAAKREMAAAVAFAIALVLLPRRARAS